MIIFAMAVGLVLSTRGVGVLVVVAGGAVGSTAVLTCGYPVVHADIITARMMRYVDNLDFIPFPICKTS